MNDWYASWGKRTLDVAGAIVGLSVCALPLLLIALLVRCRMGRPVIYRQARPGRDGTCFMIVKFRTMTDERDGSGRLRPDRERLTSLGRWLRRTSLDELPELWNVLQGDMSFVGPRPLLPSYLPYYTPSELRRHEVRPGITGLAQIQGRNALAWDRRLSLDVHYVDNMTLVMDLRILITTFVNALGGEEVAVDSGAVIRPLTELRAVQGAGAKDEERP